MTIRYFFMAPLLERLSQPAFLARLVAIILRVTATLIALLSLTIFFKVGKLTFELPTNRVLGGIFFEVLFVMAVYAAVHVLVIRARDIETLKSNDTFAISILAVLVKMAGEAYGGFMLFMSLGGGLFVWFTNQHIGNILGPVVRSLFPGANDDPSFMGGIQLMATGVLISVAALVLAYATAQALSLLVRSPVRNGGSQQFPTADLNQSYRSRFGSG